jgi:hypothetical protein
MPFDAPVTGTFSPEKSKVAFPICLSTHRIERLNRLPLITGKNMRV